MKILRKINKGVLLSIIVLICLMTYIVIVEIGRNNQKELIKEACIKYIEFENKYSVMPEEYWTAEGKVNKEDYKNEMKTKLKEMMIDNEKIYNQQKSIVDNKLECSLIESAISLNKNSKNIIVKSYTFDGDQVEVTIENTLEIEQVLLPQDDMPSIEELNKTKKTEKYNDKITLKMENGVWKIIYADIETNFAENNRMFF